MYETENGNLMKDGMIHFFIWDPCSVHDLPVRRWTMKDISIGIYHKDHQYGKRLMEYLNHQKDFPMTASFTSDEEMFFKQEQEGDFECLVLAEETDYHGDFPVCRIGANESMGGM